jgi:acylphosphatase
VRNAADGSVEIAAAGAPAAIAALREALLEGPPGSRVDELRELPPIAAAELPNPFTVLK